MTERCLSKFGTVKTFKRRGGKRLGMGRDVRRDGVSRGRDSATPGDEMREVTLIGAVRV